MKVAVLFLFAFIAVSQAAFTVNLKQRAAPVLAKTFAQARFQLRARSDEGLQTTLFQTLQEHANALIEEISTSIANGVQVANGVYESLQETIDQLSQLGGQAVDTAVSIMSNLWNNIFGGWGSKSRLDLGTITDVFTSLGLDQIIGDAFNHVVDLISGLEVPAFIQAALSALFNWDIVQQIMGALFGRQRGIFGDLISSISGAASNLAGQIAGWIGSVQDTLASGLATITEIATSILGEAQSQVMQITQEAANALIEQLAPFAHDMGAMYDQLVAAITGMISKH